MKVLNGFILDDYRLRKSVHNFVPSRVDTRGSEYCENVYVTLNNTLSRTPFKMPQKGLYRFDGQVFYKKTAMIGGKL